MSLRALNKLIGSTYADIESLNDGIAFLRVLDKQLPGVVDLRKMNTRPSTFNEKLHNISLITSVLPGASLDPSAIADGSVEDIRALLKLLLGSQESIQALTFNNNLSFLSIPESVELDPSGVIFEQAAYLAELITDLSSEVHVRMKALEANKDRINQLIEKRNDLFSKLHNVEILVNNVYPDIQGSDLIREVLIQKPKNF
ncbi:hypothetical protein RCL1_007022 [Eukaryota sp. TZLM3-RCL]